MDSLTHTPEPWEISPRGSVIAPGKSSALLFDKPFSSIFTDSEEQAANVSRIVACVNGCKGIVDPETTVPALIAALETIAAYSSEGRIRLTALNALAQAKGA